MFRTLTTHFRRECLATSRTHMLVSRLLYMPDMKTTMILALSMFALHHGASDAHTFRASHVHAAHDTTTVQSDVIMMPELTVYASSSHHATPKDDRVFVCGPWEDLASSVLHVQRCEWVSR